MQRLPQGLCTNVQADEVEKGGQAGRHARQTAGEQDVAHVPADSVPGFRVGSVHGVAVARA